MINPQVSWFSSFSSDHPKDCSLKAILKAIKEDDRYKSLIDNLRVVRQTDVGAYNIQKRSLPAFTISGTAKNRKEPLEHSGLIQGDLDHLGDKLNSVRDILKEDPHVAFLFVSPSGDGLKFGIVVDPTNHKHSFLSAQHHFKEKYQLEIDPSVKDRLRLCFVSYDPYLWVNESAIPVPLLPVEVEKPRIPQSVTSTSPKQSRQQIAESMFGAIQWETDYHGFLTCPGAGIHTTQNNPKDCEIHLEKTPNIHCFHGSCTHIVAGVNHQLQSLIGKAEYVKPVMPERNGFRDEYFDSQNPEIEKTPEPIFATPIGDLVLPPENDPSELLKYRFLCLTQSLLFVGSTGKGKSSALLQALALWSLGKGFFGIQPTRPLKSIYIQAENDDGDIASIRDGICTGLSFTNEERAIFFASVLVFTETARSGKAFCAEVVKPLLVQYPDLDICAIDPALSYLGGDTKEQRDVGIFLRNHLNPILHEQNVACIINHHTNKISTNTNEEESRDFAYSGSGSAEWANWARAMLVLESTKNKDVFRLHAAKRGQKLDWRNEDGSRRYSTLIAHSNEPGIIYWRSAEDSELQSNAGRKRSWNDYDLCSLLKDKPLSTASWQKLAFSELNLSRSRFYDALKSPEIENRALKSKTDNLWHFLKKQ